MYLQKSRYRNTKTVQTKTTLNKPELSGVCRESLKEQYSQRFGDAVPVAAAESH